MGTTLSSFQNKPLKLWQEVIVFWVLILAVWLGIWAMNQPQSLGQSTDAPQLLAIAIRTDHPTGRLNLEAPLCLLRFATADDGVGITPIDNESWDRLHDKIPRIDVRKRYRVLTPAEISLIEPSRLNRELTDGSDVLRLECQILDVNGDGANDIMIQRDFRGSKMTKTMLSAYGPVHGELAPYWETSIAFHNEVDILSHPCVGYYMKGYAGTMEIYAFHPRQAGYPGHHLEQGFIHIYYDRNAHRFVTEGIRWRSSIRLLLTACSSFLRSPMSTVCVLTALAGAWFTALLAHKLRPNACREKVP